MAQQSSRLHRLLTLLDTGSTTSTRRTAARQIGEIAKSHPEELSPLLKKVSPYLRSKNWDTRVAAALAIGAIAENVSHISVKELIENAESELVNLGENINLKDFLAATFQAECNTSTALSFSRFDLQKVLDHGVPLLSSGGQEYDIGVDNRTFAEQLARQKQNLRRRLGLDVCEQFMDVNDMIRDDDLIFDQGSNSCFLHQSHSVSRGTEGKQGVQQLVANMVPGLFPRALSARQRNLLKRRAKVIVKDGPKGLCDDDDVEEPSSKRTKIIRPVIVDQPQGGDKLLMESLADEEGPGVIADGQWPFSTFAELLSHDMFDPVWEVRHGSIMALREILSLQASSAEVVASDLGGLTYDGVKAEIPLSGYKTMEIDLNIGLNLDENSDLKRVKLENGSNGGEKMAVDNWLGLHGVEMKVPKVEPKLDLELVTTGICAMNPDLVADTELDLSKYTPSLSLSQNVKQSYFEVIKERGLNFNISNILCNMQEDSKGKRLLRASLQAWAANSAFLQDSAVRFLCIFALDRFGDYVSDQVVAPVRETCAQALGAVLKHMHPYFVHETLSILLQMQNAQEWEVRHGGLLGIKYLVAVRQEMLYELLPRVLPACIVGLEDPDDDVRAVAAESLIPAARAIVSFAGDRVNTILLMLWDILLDLDDLSPSTSSVMHLLAELYSQPEVVPGIVGTIPAKRPILDLNEAIGQDDDVGFDPEPDRDAFLLSKLAPRLWPFMRHSISSVRHAAICTLERLLQAGKHEESLGRSIDCLWAVPILGDALRLVFQNLLLESDETIIECSNRVWRLLIQCPADDLAQAAGKYFSSWLRLASTAAGSPLEVSKMFSPTLPRKSNSRAAAKLRAVKGGSSSSGHSTWQRLKEDEFREKGTDSSLFSCVSKVVVGADNDRSVVNMRVATASALGIIAASLPESLYGTLVEALAELVASLSGVLRQVASLVLISWFKELRERHEETRIRSAAAATKALRLRLLELLSCADPAFPTPDVPLPYTELTRTYTKMRGELTALLKYAESSGCSSQLTSAGSLSVDTINADAAIDLAVKVASHADSSGDGSANDKKISNADVIEPSRQRLLATAGYLKLVQGNLHVSVLASIASAIVWMGELPAKLNPVIQPLMSAIKREQEEALQQHASEALAEIIDRCVGRKPSPNEKLIRNICMLTCADTIETPQATPATATFIVSDDCEVGITSKSAVQRQRSQAHVASAGEERSRMEGLITRRGAELALKSLCDKFGDLVFDKLPKLWDCLTEAFKLVGSEAIEHLSSDACGLISEQNTDPQALINNLQVLRSISPVLDKNLQSKISMLFPAIFGCLRHSHAAVRLASARCITSMAKAWREPVMLAVLERAVPMLGDSSAVEARQGAGMLVASLVEGLGADLVAYAPILIVPLLGCMSDSDHAVRQTVTQSFAALVPLLPLARGVALPSDLDERLSSRSVEDTRFLEQLLDNSQVDDYKLFVELKTPLRRYQQEGINWLAFLKRFKLHGILCDDMGLGKTLQAMAIVASDIAERLAKHDGSVDKDSRLLPSIIICPSTLVGHWVFEITKFLETSVLNPLQYVGSPQDRLQLQGKFGAHNLIVTSYDVLRKDADVLAKVVWNYCILDEGHIIKNSKSKITIAVKRIKAEHRLILSGTPIQNNVLELWSLFDFLMPGFLGTERQFQSTYGKPILAARDAKCSAKEAEAGALAMEALHKQVMPFLLRRTKDDVLADLPPKIIQDRYCELSPLQLKLYEKFAGSHAKREVASIVETYDESSDYGGDCKKTSTHVFQALQYLRKLCSHPLLVLDEVEPDLVASIQATSASRSSDVSLNFHELHHAPKLLALKEILEECGIGLTSINTDNTISGETCDLAEGGHHRVLVFAQMKRFLDIIEKDLFQTHMKDVTYLRLDGSVDPEKRFDIVKAFNSDPTIDVLLLTTHVGGLGLNLTSADTVIFMEHDWNPMRDLQAMDRAHRLGQKRVVNVHRLIMRGTLEEKVMSLQRFKLSVANAVINAENASLNTMDTTQLLDLFSISASGKSDPKLTNTDIEQDAAIGTGKGLKAMLSGLEELWDETQYNEEYDLNQFLARLNG